MPAVTPTQLRAFVTVVRQGSVKRAAAELGVTEAAVSGHVAQLRKELDDPLFTRAGAGLAFTPGGLRLASRGVELLGLADQTVREVSQAGHGRRLLRLSASSLFAEYAAPGLIELFAGRAADLEVELTVVPPSQLGTLVGSRAADVAIGPQPRELPEDLVGVPFLKYQVVVVARPGHQLAGVRARPAQLREQVWLLGPSAVDRDGVVPAMLRTFDVPERNQRIFQNHAAALEEAQRGSGVAPALAFGVSEELAAGRLARVEGRGTHADGVWTAISLPTHSRLSTSSELMRFLTTPRATQAMLHGAGADVGRFRPSVHVTLWS